MLPNQKEKMVLQLLTLLLHQSLLKNRSTKLRSGIVSVHLKSISQLCPMPSLQIPRNSWELLRSKSGLKTESCLISKRLSICLSLTCMIWKMECKSMETTNTTLMPQSGTSSSRLSLRLRNGSTVKVRMPHLMFSVKSFKLFKQLENQSRLVTSWGRISRSGFLSSTNSKPKLTSKCQLLPISLMSKERALPRRFKTMKSGSLKSDLQWIALQSTLIFHTPWLWLKTGMSKLKKSV